MDILRQISDCIVNMDEDRIEDLIKMAIDIKCISHQDIFLKGLNDGMVRAIRIYDNKEYDIPELIVCADTLNKGVNVLSSYGSLDNENKGKLLLAVVEGDTHEIGKNIVKIMVEAAGYDIVDMGVNRKVEDIITKAIAEQVDIIGLSSMMTTTRGEMKKLVDKINAMNLDHRPYVIVGGGSITENYAKEIGADGYSTNAPNAIKLIEKLIGRESR